MSKSSYTATYEPKTMNGEHGFWYRCFAAGRLIFEGWSRGRKSLAELEVCRGIRDRETLRACAGLV